MIQIIKKKKKENKQTNKQTQKKSIEFSLKADSYDPETLNLYILASCYSMPLELRRY
jgi:hypothetical protein